MMFDERGLIVPAEKVAMTLSEFDDCFVRAFPSTSTRQSIFSSYRYFVDRFGKEVSPSFTHWIDGSFVTNKTNPNDLDLVTFIDDEVYTAHQELIDGTFRLTGARQNFPGVDAYTVRLYPDSNELGCFVAHSDRLYWQDLFSQTRPNRVGKRYRKGFIELLFNS